MNRAFHWRPTILALAAAVLSGCATTPRGAKDAGTGAGQPGSEPGFYDDFSDDTTERRVEAMARYGAGLLADLSGEGSAARDHFLKSIESDPGHEALVLELVRDCLESKDYEQAVGLLTRATASPRASAKTFAWLGLVCAQTGRTNQAIQASQEAVRLSPVLIMGYRNLFDLFEQLNEPSRARAVLDQAAGQSATEPEFWIELAGLYSRHRQLHPDQSEVVRPRIVAMLDRCADLKPREILLVQKLADGYRLNGEWMKAEGFCLELLERIPVLPGLRAKLAEIYLRTDRSEKAAEHLEVISRETPGNPPGYFILGILAHQEDRRPEAAEYYQKARVLEPGFEPVYYRLAELKIGLDKPREALEVLGEARRRFKPNYLLEILDALAHTGAEQYADAVRRFSAAEIAGRTEDPGRLDHVFFFQFGSALERNGDYAEAEKYFRKSLVLSPNFAAALNYLGYMWADRDENLVEAKGLIEKAVELEPRNAAYLDSMGWVLFKLREPHAALHWLKMAIEHSDEPDPVLYDHLGDIHAELKQLDQARDAWRKSVELDPTEPVKKKLEQSSGSRGSGK